MKGRLLAGMVLVMAEAFAQKSLHFVGLEVNKETDKKLVTYLQNKDNLQFQTHTLGYGAAIRRVADWNETEPYLAHLTPYAYVAAEMLGAKFEILATYHSPRPESTVYHSYFVVNHEDFAKFLNGRDPTLELLPAYLKFKRQEKPAKFIYHDKFSTSSYFLPSLYFRREHIFAIDESVGGSQIPIQVEKTPAGTGSSFLVRQVAEGNADLAAVWDETKTNAEHQYAQKVDFIPLDTHIPNDLLVACALLDAQTKEEILRAIRETREDKDWKPYDKEFQFWVDIRNATEALDALGELRQLGARRAPDVTVEIGKSPEVPDEIFRAVQDGVRLSSTEFVLYQKDFHKTIDVTWKVKTVHDGALAIESTIGGVDLSQSFRISFKDAKDLTSRVAALVQFRMHRIRYVWPYEDNSPSVIRDLDFAPEDVVKVQRIIWTDPERNEYYEQGTPFDAHVVKANDTYKLQLSEGLFPRGQQGSFQFEPMSNVAYRVVLRRPSAESTLFAALTWMLLGCFILAAAGFTWDLRRKRPPPAGFVETRRRMIENYYRPWCTRQIKDTDVLWCDAKIDQTIDRFRGGGNPFSKEIKDVSLPWIHLSVGALTWAFRQIFGERLGLAPELVDAADAGDAAALERLIKLLVRNRRLARFTGRTIEWDALEDMVRRNFRRLGMGPAASAAQLRRDSALAGLVSRYFQDALTGGSGIILLHYRWEIDSSESEGVYALSHEEVLGGQLRLALKEGLVVTRTLLVTCKIPAAPGFREALASCGGEAWLLGIRKEAPASRNGSGQVRLELEPLALLKPILAPEEAPLLRPVVSQAEAVGD